jgi:hypothetical protein
LTNRLTDVTARCNTQVWKIEGKREITNMLINNGFNNEDIARAEKSNRVRELNRKYRSKSSQAPFVDHNCHILKLPFTTDRTMSDIQSYIRQNNLPFKTVFTNGPKISQVKRINHSTRCIKQCDVCDKLPAKYSCRVKFVVYKFTCKICQLFYIGKTSVFIKDRYSQHRNSILKKDRVSALSQHILECHNENRNGIDIFDLDILSKHKDNMETVISESIFINRLSPKLNRKHELVAINTDFTHLNV